jgi:hypothetical protein
VVRDLRLSGVWEITDERLRVLGCGVRMTFEIIEYNMNKGLGNDIYIASATFSVGGYQWGIRYYLDDTLRRTTKSTSLSSSIS